MQLSFRDPDGFVFRSGSRILRLVHPHAVEHVSSFLSSPAAIEWMARGTLISTTVSAGIAALDLPPELGDKIPKAAVILEHKPILFASYPYEWAPEMLHSAAALTLQLAHTAVRAGFGLKDATPYNIMFEGPRPVFIDLLSFERRDPLDAIWRPYAQFIRTFVYPLLASKYFGLRLDELLLVHRDGLEPEKFLQLCSLWRMFLPPFLGSATIPVLLSRWDRGSTPIPFRSHPARDMHEARCLLDHLFKRAKQDLKGISLLPPKDAVSRYMHSGHTYTDQEFIAKEEEVSAVLERYRPACVLDVGCNTGHFSFLAARYAESVIAIDQDAGAVGRLWRDASDKAPNILALVVDIARPPGACGWANSECASFLDRARGRFNCILMLALIHHLLVNERVPLDMIFELAAELTTKLAIVEYIDPADPQFQRILRGRDVLHRDLTRDRFEASAYQRFEVIQFRDVTPTRRIYTLHKRGA